MGLTSDVPWWDKIDVIVKPDADVLASPATKAHRAIAPISACKTVPKSSVSSASQLQHDEPQDSASMQTSDAGRMQYELARGSSDWKVQVASVARELHKLDMDTKFDDSFLLGTTCTLGVRRTWKYRLACTEGEVTVRTARSVAERFFEGTKAGRVANPAPPPSLKRGMASEPAAAEETSTGGESGSADGIKEQVLDEEQEEGPDGKRQGKVRRVEGMMGPSASRGLNACVIC